MKRVSIWLLGLMLGGSVLLGGQAENSAPSSQNQPAVTEEAVFDAAIIQDRRAVRANAERTKVRKGRISRMPGKRHQRQYGLPEFSFRKDPSAATDALHVSIPTLTKSPTTLGTGSITIMINGVADDTVAVGDNIVFTIDFSDGSSEADISIWLDMDGDKVLDDAVDLMVEESMHIIDNDFEDEDTTSGLYQVTMAGDEDLATISNLHFLALAEDAGGSATAAGFI